jgi:hypothetical protein
MKNNNISISVYKLSQEERNRIDDKEIRAFVCLNARSKICRDLGAKFGDVLYLGSKGGCNKSIELFEKLEESNAEDAHIMTQLRKKYPGRSEWSLRHSDKRDVSKIATELRTKARSKFLKVT